MSEQTNTLGIPYPEPYQNYRLRFWHPKLYSGRITVAALVPKEPLPLNHVPFAISWCSPIDSFHKVRGRGQALQRLRRLLNNQGTDHAAIFIQNRNASIQSLQALLGLLVTEALILFPNIPSWAPRLDTHSVIGSFVSPGTLPCLSIIKNV